MGTVAAISPPSDGWLLGSSNSARAWTRNGGTLTNLSAQPPSAALTNLAAGTVTNFTLHGLTAYGDAQETNWMSFGPTGLTMSNALGQMRYSGGSQTNSGSLMASNSVTTSNLWLMGSATDQVVRQYGTNELDLGFTNGGAGLVQIFRGTTNVNSMNQQAANLTAAGNINAGGTFSGNGGGLTNIPIYKVCSWAYNTWVPAHYYPVADAPNNTSGGSSSPAQLYAYIPYGPHGAVVNSMTVALNYIAGQGPGIGSIGTNLTLTVYTNNAMSATGSAATGMSVTFTSGSGATVLTDNSHPFTVLTGSFWCIYLATSPSQNVSGSLSIALNVTPF